MILFNSKHSEPTVILSRPTDVLHITWSDRCQWNTYNCYAQCDCRWSWPSNTLWVGHPRESPDSKCRCKKSLDAHSGMVVDVLSIGSKTRPELVSTLDGSLPNDRSNFLMPHATFYFSAHCTNRDMGITLQRSQLLGRD